MTVSFNASSSTDNGGTISTYSWNFGDGSTGTGETVSHIYNTAGNFHPVLTIKDIHNATAIYNLPAVTVASVPTAKATATPSSGSIPLTVSFNGSSSTDAGGSIASYAWNFGDGTTGTGASVNHVFTTVGSFLAVLTVTDNHGVTAATFNLPAVTTSSPVGVAIETPTSETLL